jgi:hypothetical protein
MEDVQVFKYFFCAFKGQILLSVHCLKTLKVVDSDFNEKIL